MPALETTTTPVTSRVLAELTVSTQGSCPPPSPTGHRGEQPVARTRLTPAFGFRVAAAEMGSTWPSESRLLALSLHQRLAFRREKGTY